MLQFITNTDSQVPVAEQVKAVIDGGCKWVQIRMKDASDDEIRGVVDNIKSLCIEKEVFLLLDDRVGLAKELNVGGVHLGKEDMPPGKARMILGPAAVIGVTANTLADVLAVSQFDIDYFGFGPFSTTTTKKNLAPILGIDGIRRLCSGMKEQEINIPCVAVGGIRYDDLALLIEAGVNGVAVSGAIANAKDIVKETERFVAALPKFD